MRLEAWLSGSYFWTPVSVNVIPVHHVKFVHCYLKHYLNIYTYYIFYYINNIVDYIVIKWQLFQIWHLRSSYTSISSLKLLNCQCSTLTSRWQDSRTDSWNYIFSSWWPKKSQAPTRPCLHSRVPSRTHCYIKPFKVPPRSPQQTQGENMNHWLAMVPWGTPGVPWGSPGFLESPLILWV